MTTQLIDRIAGFTALPSPHLQVVGERAGEMALALLSRIAPEARVIVLGDGRESAITGPHAHRAARFALVGALTGAEGLALVREQLLSAAARHGEAAAAALVSPEERAQAKDQAELERQGIADAIDAQVQRAAAAESLSDFPAVVVHCPPGSRVPDIVTAIEDMISHAQARGLPAPRAQVLRRSTTVTRSAAEAKVDLVRGVIAPEELRILLAIADPEDWRPYAAAAWSPDLPEAVLATEIDLEIERLRANPDFAKGTAEALHELAAGLVDERRWPIAIARASRATRTGRSSDAQTLLALLTGEKGIPQQAVLEVSKILGGPAETPTWWANDLVWIDIVGEPSLRLEALIESIGLRAQHVEAFGLPKVLIVDLTPVLESHSQAPLAAIARLLRTGRKLRLSVVLLAQELVGEMSEITHLVPNWLTSDAARGALPLLRAAELDIPAGPGGGWWQSSAADLPIPLDTWFSAEDLAAGERLLQGVPDATR